MIDALFNGANYQGVKKMLDATALRQEAIASNLASFASELSHAIGSGSADTVRGVKARITVDTSAVAQNRDGNTVQLEKELMLLQKNMVAHHMQTQMINGTFSKLRAAIKPR